MTYYVYMMTDDENDVLYTGMTNDIHRRAHEHREELVDGFTKRYHLHKLVMYESCSDVNAAIAREKQLKGWTRVKKNALIEEQNPEWLDLFPRLC